MEPTRSLPSMTLRAMSAGEAAGVDWQTDPCLVWSSTAVSSWRNAFVSLPSGGTTNRVISPEEVHRNVTGPPARFPHFAVDRPHAPGVWTARAEREGRFDTLTVGFAPTWSDAAWIFLARGSERALVRAVARDAAGRPVAEYVATSTPPPARNADTNEFRFVTLTWPHFEEVASLELVFAPSADDGDVLVDAVGLHARERAAGAQARVDWAPRRPPTARLAAGVPMIALTVVASVVLAFGAIVFLLVVPPPPLAAPVADATAAPTTDPAIDVVPLDSVLATPGVRWAHEAHLFGGETSWTRIGSQPWPNVPPSSHPGEWTPAWQSGPGVDDPPLYALHLTFPPSDEPVAAVHVSMLFGPLAVVGVEDATLDDRQERIWLRTQGSRAGETADPSRTLRVRVDPPRPIHRIFLILRRGNAPEGHAIMGVALEPAER